MRMLTRGLLAGAAIMAVVASDALAQAARNVPNAMQGFSQNRDKPVQIEAATLEVRDKDKVATFSGNVKVVQGDTTMRCRSLTVFYEEQAPAGATGSTMRAATPGPAGQGQISRLEAKGGVVVTQKEQTATGDTGLFDMRSNTVTLLGNVVVTQGTNVLRGDRLVVDITNGTSKIDGGKSQTPVRVLIEQKGAPTREGNSLMPGAPKLGPLRPN